MVYLAFQLILVAYMSYLSMKYAKRDQKWIQPWNLAIIIGCLQIFGAIGKTIGLYKYHNIGIFPPSTTIFSNFCLTLSNLCLLYTILLFSSGWYFHEKTEDMPNITIIVLLMISQSISYTPISILSKTFIAYLLYQKYTPESV